MGIKIGGICEMLSPNCDLDDVMFVNTFLNILNKLNIPEKHSHSFVQRLLSHIQFKHMKHQ